MTTAFSQGGERGFAYKARRAAALARREIIGIAHDFWKDGGKESQVSYAAWQAAVTKAEEGPPPQKGWHALPGEISEHMWGKGIVIPADEQLFDLLIQPLTLQNNMSVLDLSAGLGARMRKATHVYGSRIDGREPDPEIAARARTVAIDAGVDPADAISAYDPMNLIEARKYDCVIARETIYRAADKTKLITSIAACCKPHAQVSFTDYVVNPEVKSAPAILAWQAYEIGAAPVGLVEMAEFWAKAGISLRVHQDWTDSYKSEVKKGLIRLADFLASSPKPDEATRKSIEKRITTWAHRVAALENGMKLYRFYGVR